MSGQFIVDTESLLILGPSHHHLDDPEPSNHDASTTLHRKYSYSYDSFTTVGWTLYNCRMDFKNIDITLFFFFLFFYTCIFYLNVLSLSPLSGA